MNVHDQVILELREKYRHYSLEVAIPPPIFSVMEGKVLEYSNKNKYIKIAFPVLKEYLNPFGNMQGGMLAAAIDNTFGPLSMLVAPLNFTRKLEIKYKKPVRNDICQIYVVGTYIDRNERRVSFAAKVLDEEQNVLATAKADHWIVDGLSVSRKT